MGDFTGCSWVRDDGTNKLSFEITHVPGRKQVALCIGEYRRGHGAWVDVLGYFRDEEHAEKAIAVLEQFIVARDMTADTEDGA